MSSTNIKAQSSKFKTLTRDSDSRSRSQDFYATKKQMKAERNVPRTAGSPRGQPAWGASTLRGTLLLRMATPDTLAKQRHRHPEGSLPSSKDSTRKIAWSFFTNRYFDCQKTKRAGFKPPREAARSFNSRDFCFEIWERESAPAN